MTVSEPIPAGDEGLLSFPVDRIGDNRLKGLLREILEAIEDCDSPETLRSVGQSLKLLGDQARSKGFRRQSKAGNRVW